MVIHMGSWKGVKIVNKYWEMKKHFTGHWRSYLEWVNLFFRNDSLGNSVNVISHVTKRKIMMLHMYITEFDLLSVISNLKIESI